MYMRPLFIACLLMAFSTSVQGEEFVVVCFGQKADNMEALVKQGDDEGADLYQRLHCWKIRPPARQPYRGTKKETPFPNITAMGNEDDGKWIRFKTFKIR